MIRFEMKNYAKWYNREAPKISTLSSDKVDKYECLRGE